MKHPLFNALIIGIVAVGTSVPLFAQTSNPWLQQWYRAKFGRQLPAETAQQSSTRRVDPAAPVAANGAAAAPASTWFENWYRDKFGRPSPLAQANRQIPQEPARRLIARNEKPQAPVNTWFEQWYRDKYGRPSPQEESRLNSGAR